MERKDNGQENHRQVSYNGGETQGLLEDMLFDVTNPMMEGLDMPIFMGSESLPNVEHSSPHEYEMAHNHTKPATAPATETASPVTTPENELHIPSAKRARWSPKDALDPEAATKQEGGHSQSHSHNHGHGQGHNHNHSHSSNEGNNANNRNNSVSPATSGKPMEIKKMTDVKSRACDECRRRKTACYYLSSDNAKCFRCQMEGIECTFSSRPRSMSSGGTRQPPITQRLTAKTQPATTGPIEDYSQLPGRSLLKKTLSLQHPRSSFSVGQHGLWDQRVLESVELDKANQARVASNLALRKVGPDSWFMIRNDGGQNDRISDCDAIEQIVYPYGSALVNVFFMYFQPEYPVLHEKIFLEKYMRTYRELMPALLGAVYLLGMRMWNMSSELSTVARPDHLMAPLYDATLMNFFKSSGGSSLSLIQAGLLLLQCSYSDSRHLSICSIINAAGYRLALNRNCLHWKLPRWEINLRMRLSWAIYSQSTWVSLFESIPPLIQDSSWYLYSLNPDMFDNGSNELSLNGALYIQLNKLSLIVHDMHNVLSSKLFMMYTSELSAQQSNANNANINAAHPSIVSPLSNMNSPDVASPPYARSSVTTETVLEMIKPIQLRLHSWYLKLPPAILNIDGDNPTGSFSLRVAYIAAEVTLHRFIIRAACRVGQAEVDPGILKVLRSSARERLDLAYELISALRPQHLRQFWYFPAAHQLAVIGLFAALMYTTSATREESEYYRTLLGRYAAKIQLYSDNEVMSTALRTLRSSIAGVPNLRV